MTKKRLLALRLRSEIINVPLTDERFRRLQFSLEDENTLLVAFNASLFHDDWSGTIEYRFQTAHAKAFFDKLRGHSV